MASVAANTCPRLSGDLIDHRCLRNYELTYAYPSRPSCSSSFTLQPERAGALHLAQHDISGIKRQHAVRHPACGCVPGSMHGSCWTPRTAATCFELRAGAVHAGTFLRSRLQRRKGFAVSATYSSHQVRCKFVTKNLTNMPVAAQKKRVTPQIEESVMTAALDLKAMRQMLTCALSD